MAEPGVRVASVLVIGLGLIGASLARALRASRFAPRIIGFDRDPARAARAGELGVVDVVADALPGALAMADLVVLAVPTLAVEAVLEDVRTHARAQAVITDVASVKGSVVEAAARVFGALPARFVPGHPIAGAERSGVDAASADLFRGCRVILAPDAGTDPQALATVCAMWRRAGAEVVEMDCETHDRVLALTSHLPHMLAFTLVDALAREDASEDIFRFAAGGFRDFTRIASSDAVMWRDIALANRVGLLSALDVFTARLAELRALVECADGPAMEAVFLRARAARGRYLRWLEQDAGAEQGGSR